jgi:hypothetical protein
MSDHVRPRVRWKVRDFSRIFSVSLRTAYRMRALHGWGKWIYANQIRRDEPELWESYILVVVVRRIY